MSILSLYYFLNMSEYTSSFLDVLESTLFLLQTCMSTHHSSPFWEGYSYIVAELGLGPTGLLHNNMSSSYMTYVMPDTWYLVNSLWVHLLLTHQKFYTMLVKT